MSFVVILYIPINRFSISLTSWSIPFVNGRWDCWPFSLLPKKRWCIDGIFELNNLYSGTWSKFFTVLLLVDSVNKLLLVFFGEHNIAVTGMLIDVWDKDFVVVGWDDARLLVAKKLVRSSGQFVVGDILYVWVWIIDGAICGSCSDDVWDDVDVVSESTFIAVVLVNVSVLYPLDEWWCISSPDSKSEDIAEFVVGNNGVAWLGCCCRCGESFLLLK